MSFRADHLGFFWDFAVADVGQEEDFEAARVKALKVGAKKFVLKVW